MKDRIICAAIWVKDGKTYPSQPKNIPDGYVMCGHRHHNIVHLRTALLGIKNSSDDNDYQVMGFITNDNYFVNRFEARTIAIKNGQIKDETAFHGTKLFSEDLY